MFSSALLSSALLSSALLSSALLSSALLPPVREQTAACIGLLRSVREGADGDADGGVADHVEDVVKVTSAVVRGGGCGLFLG
eukprot:6212623-Pleurochrysis_carterae.AAC.3